MPDRRLTRAYGTTSKIFGFRSLADAIGPKLAEKIQITKTTQKYAMIQRCALCLYGVGHQVGFGGVSASKLWYSAAKKFLRAVEKQG